LSSGVAGSPLIKGGDMHTRLAKQFHGLKRTVFLAIAGVLPLLAIGLLTQSLQAQESLMLVSTPTPTEFDTSPQGSGCWPDVTIDEQTANLVPNPGFEHKIPQSSQWLKGADDDYKKYLAWDCNVSHNGTCSARIDGGSDQSLFWFTHNTRAIEFPRDYEYFVFSGFVRSNLREGEGKAWISIGFLDEDGHWIRACSTSEITGSTSGAWIKLAGIAQAPSNAHYARIECHLAESSLGTVWFDDMHLGVATALSISKKDHVEEIGTGEPLTYTVVCTNVGREKATGVLIVEDPGDYLSIEGGNPPPVITPNVWIIDSLLPTNSYTIIVDARVASETNGHCILENRVHATSNETIASVTCMETTPVSNGPNSCYVSLRPPSDLHRHVNPGTEVLYHFSLLNDGKRDGWATLDRHSSQDFTTIPDPSGEISLPVGRVQPVTLTLVVPDDEPVETDTTWLTATLQCGASSDEDSAVVTTTVNHFPYVDIEPDLDDYCAPTLTFVHVVTNTGNYTDRFDLDCDAGCAAKGCTCDISPQLTEPLKPGESVQVTATINSVPCGAIIKSENLTSETVVTVTATSCAKDYVFDWAKDEIRFWKIYLPVVMKNFDPVCAGDPDPTGIGWWDDWGGNLATPSVVAGSLYISPILSVPPLCGNRAFLLGDPDFGPCKPPEETIPVGESGVTKIVGVDQDGSPVLSFCYRMVTYDIKGDDVVDPLDTFEVTVNGTPVFIDGNPKLHSSGKCHDMDWDSLVDWNSVQAQFPGTYIGPLMNGWRRVTVDLDPSKYGNSMTVHFANWNRDYCGITDKDSNNTFTYLDSVQIIE